MCWCAVKKLLTHLLKYAYMPANMTIYHMKSRHIEQNVGWRKYVAINLCPFTWCTRRRIAPCRLCKGPSFSSFCLKIRSSGTSAPTKQKIKMYYQQTAWKTTRSLAIANTPHDSLSAAVQVSSQAWQLFYLMSRWDLVPLLTWHVFNAYLKASWELNSLRNWELC